MISVVGLIVDSVLLHCSGKVKPSVKVHFEIYITVIGFAGNFEWNLKSYLGATQRYLPVHNFATILVFNHHNHLIRGSARLA